LDRDTDHEPTTEELERDLDERLRRRRDRAREQEEKPRYYKSGHIRRDLDDQEITPPG
jgi:hypothetical protein